MKKKNTILLTIIVIVTLLVAFIGASFAYFVIVEAPESNPVLVNIETARNANIYYEKGNDLDLMADQPGIEGELNFRVKLAANANANVRSKYNIEWNIGVNDFEYDPDSNNNTPELVYEVYLSLDRRTWQKIVPEQDCTNWKGAHIIVRDQIIEANAGMNTFNYWRIVLRYQNLNKVQNYNQGKNFASIVKIINVE